MVAQILKVVGTSLKGSTIDQRIVVVERSWMCSERCRVIGR